MSIVFFSINLMYLLLWYNISIKYKMNVLIMKGIVVHAMIVKIQKMIKFIINIIVFIVVNKFMDKKIKMKQMEVNIVYHAKI